MNDDSDESEYVDDNESGASTRRTRAKSAKAKRAFKKNPVVKAEEPREPSSALEEPFHATTHPKDHATSKIKTSVLRAYRDLLNSNIADVFERTGDVESDSLQPSQIGASSWTSGEKHLFFAALESRGPGDLYALATAVGTKSEPEIKAYILLLQQGVRELDSKSRLEFGSADLPAAIEIGEECLEAEEAVAGVVEAKVRAAEEGEEKRVWGEEQWLIDEDAAAAMDFRSEESSKEDAGQNDAGATPVNDTEDQPNNSPLTSDQLLKPSAFLQLSRSVFMNSKHDETNWHTISQNDPSGLGPSIRRTALDDFFNLAISLTRRLMQVSIFQALSRLRASSDPRALPNVHSFDVNAARETMGLKTREAKYWAEAIKRCGVEVYTDAKKYRAEDGRKGTKIGCKLSESELEAELGVLAPDAAVHTRVGPDGEVEEDDLDDLDSDAYTDTGSSEHSTHSTSDAEAKPRSHRAGSRGRELKDRRRPLSPSSFARAEAKFIESLDRIKSTAGENDLRSILDLDLLPERKAQKPAFPFKQTEVELRASEWRDRVQYEAAWEQPDGLPQKREFETMGLEGARRRKRRRVMAGKSGNAIDSDDEAESESPDESGEEEDQDGEDSDAGSEESHPAIDSEEE